MDRDGIGVTGRNAGARHIEMWGNFSDHTPPVQQWDATATLAASLLREADLKTDALHMHRHSEITECPGQAMADEWPWFVDDVGDALEALRGDPDRPLSPPPLLLEKATWWAEELLRAIEAGDTLRALEIAKDNALWLARARDTYRG